MPKPAREDGNDGASKSNDPWFFGPSFTRGFVVFVTLGSLRKECEVVLYERLLEEREREEVARKDSESGWSQRPSIFSYVPHKEWEKCLGPGPYGYVTGEEIAEELAERRRRRREELEQRRGEVELLAGFVERGGPSGLASAYMYHYLKRKHPYAYDRLMSEKWSQSTGV